MKYALILFSILLSVLPASADDPVIEMLYNRSDLIILAEFPFKEDFSMDSKTGPAFTRNVFAMYLPRVHVISFLKGAVHKDRDFRIWLQLSQAVGESAPPLPKAKQRYIIFLEDSHDRGGDIWVQTKNVDIYLRTFDHYISYVPENQALINEIKELRQAELMQRPRSSKH